MSTFESKELHVRQSILYTVGRICDNQVQKQQQQHHARARPAMSKEAMALLADLVYKQSEVMATELQFFARHANRKIIKSEDVTLLARKHPHLTHQLQQYQRKNLNSSVPTVASVKKRRKNLENVD